MLLTKVVKIKWNGKTKKHYEQFGYKYTKTNNEFEVKVKHLSDGSKAILELKCDYCGKIIEQCYKDYIKKQNSINPKDCCGNCITQKAIETNYIKYGVKSTFELKETQEKVKQTNLERYGVERPAQSKEIQEKTKQTNLEKYGVEYTFQLEIIKDKIKNTMLKNYGCESHLSNKEIRKQIDETNIKKYGCKNPMQNKEINNKAKQTCLDKYGVENYTRTKEYIEKSKQTSLEKYGKEYYTQTDEFKERYKQTCLKRYGVDNVRKDEKIKRKIIIKANKTMYQNGTGICTKPQRYIYQLLKNESICKLNYPIDRIRLDIAFPEDMIYIEYDGGGHNLSVIHGDITQKEFDIKEIKRKRYLQNKDWKLIRIISNKDWIPQDDDIINLISNAKQYLLNSNHSWYEIDIDKLEIRCAEYNKQINLDNLRKIKN